MRSRRRGKEQCSRPPPRRVARSWDRSGPGPRNRVVLRRDRGRRSGAGRVGSGRSGAEPGRRSRPVRRRGAGDRRPRAFGPPARHGARRAGPGRGGAVRPRRDRRKQRPRADRRADRRRRLRQGHGAVTRHPVRRGQSPRSPRADRTAARPGRARGCLPLSAPAAVGRALPVPRGRGRRPLPAARRHHRRRGRRGVRQGREAARPRLARRPRAGAPGPRRRPGTRAVSPPAAGPARLRLQLFRLEDRGGDPRRQRSRPARCRGRTPPTSPPGSRQRSPRCWRTARRRRCG